MIYAGIHLGSIGARSLEHHEDGTGLATDVGDEVVAHGANLHISHITQMKQMTAVAGLEHDVIELLDGFQRSLVLHRVLVGIFRLGS